MLSSGDDVVTLVYDLVGVRSRRGGDQVVTRVYDISENHKICWSTYLISDNCNLEIIESYNHIRYIASTDLPFTTTRTLDMYIYTHDNIDSDWLHIDSDYTVNGVTPDWTAEQIQSYWHETVYAHINNCSNGIMVMDVHISDVNLGEWYFSYM